MKQMKIGKYIAERRKKQSLLQKDVAAKLGVSEKTISKWECGNGLPEVVYMEPLCQILGITINELLAGESIPILELISALDVSRMELVSQSVNSDCSREAFAFSALRLLFCIMLICVA